MPPQRPYVPSVGSLCENHEFAQEYVVDLIALPLYERYSHNRGMMNGYARVSTDGQNVAAQVAALTAAGAVNVSRAGASGAHTDRAPLRQVLARLAAITGTGAGCTSLGDAWADTPPPHGRLLRTVLGGLAEFERDWTASPAPARDAPARRPAGYTSAGARR